jgi:hypothetical protein
MMKPLGGGSARQLVPCVGTGQYGVHGNEVYYCACSDAPDWAADTPVHAIDLSTGRDRVVGILQGGAPSFGVSVSPDGKSILYEHHISAGADLMLIENFK